MESINSAVNTAMSMQQAQINSEVSVSVLKKALQIQSEGAAALLQALPQPTYSNPPNLGQNVDIKA